MLSSLTAEAFIEKYQLECHQEGGYFSEVHPPEAEIELDFGIVRPARTSIHFLLNENDFSAWHKLTHQDETWIFKEGSALVLRMIHPATKALTSITLGDLKKHKRAISEFTVPKGMWFCADLVDKSSFAYVHANCISGFSYDDFILGSRKTLITLFPEYSALIEEFTRG